MTLGVSAWSSAFRGPGHYGWRRGAATRAHGAAPVRSTIKAEGDLKESRGHRVERLRRAQIKHDVGLAKKKAREELSQVAWVKQKKRDEQEAYETEVSAWGSRRSGGVGLGAAPEREPRKVPEEDQRCIRVGILGVPNAGKSQLVNTLVGAQVSAVSAKTNTTRVETLGAVTKGVTQVVLLDLPGVVGPEHYRNPTHGTKVAGAWAAASDCDLLLFIVDAHRQVKRPDPRIPYLLSTTRHQLGRIRRGGEATGVDIPPAALALNKVDLFEAQDRDRLKVLAHQLAQVHPFEQIFPMSAKRGKGTNALLEYCIENAPKRRWDLEPNKTTDKSMIDQAIEVVRECVYQRLHKELPYNIVPYHDSWENFENGSYKIEQYLLVDSVSMKQIVVGRRGSTIGQIGIRARMILQEMFGRRVHLVLHVRIRKKNNSLTGQRRTSAFAKY